MKLHYEFFKQSGLIVVRTGNPTVTLTLLKTIVDILKNDFPDANDDNICLEHFDPPEYSYSSFGISYKYTGSEGSLSRKYQRIDM